MWYSDFLAEFDVTSLASFVVAIDAAGYVFSLTGSLVIINSRAVSDSERNFAPSNLP
jgi:hypothetical protein